MWGGKKGEVHIRRLFDRPFRRLEFRLVICLTSLCLFSADATISLATAQTRNPHWSDLLVSFPFFFLFGISDFEYKFNLLSLAVSGFWLQSNPRDKTRNGRSPGRQPRDYISAMTFHHNFPETKMLDHFCSPNLIAFKSALKLNVQRFWRTTKLMSAGWTPRKAP